MPKRKNRKYQWIDIILPSIFGLGVGAILYVLVRIVMMIFEIIGGVK